MDLEDCTCGMTSLVGHAVAGWSGDAERLEWPLPTPLGLLETRGDLGESGPAESSTGASRPRSDPQQWLKRISKHDTT
jgi:hypothetical protein